MIEKTLCPYLIGCEVEDIRTHNCGNYKQCEIYQINEMFTNVYGEIGVRKTYTPILRLFKLEDLEDEKPRE